MQIALLEDVSHRFTQGCSNIYKGLEGGRWTSGATNAHFHFLLSVNISRKNSYIYHSVNLSYLVIILIINPFHQDLAQGAPSSATMGQRVWRDGKSAINMTIVQIERMNIQ